MTAACCHDKFEWFDPGRKWCDGCGTHKSAWLATTNNASNASPVIGRLGPYGINIVGVGALLLGIVVGTQSDVPAIFTYSAFAASALFVPFGYYLNRKDRQ